MTDAPNPFHGLPDALTPKPPAEMPAPQEVGDAMASASPFTQPLDWDDISKNLNTNRPLKLFIPREIFERYAGYEFRIINSIASEIATAHNRGFREVTEPDAVGLFASLVAGTDKEGKAFRPILCARPKKIGEEVRRRYRLQLQSLYAGMDPKNKEFNSKYVENVKDGAAASKGQFTGANWRIRV